MSDEVSNFRILMQRIAAGSEDAAWELVSTYARHVERTIRRTMSPRLRSTLDTVDYAQAVWASFFRQRDQFAKFENEDHLVRFLVGVARHKVLLESRKHYDASKRNVRREVSLEQNGESDAHRLPCVGGTPSQWAVAREKWESLMRGQTPQHRRVILMRISGATYDEIGVAIGVSSRTARRVIEELAAEIER